MNLTQKQQDIRRKKAWDKLDKRIYIAETRCKRTIIKAYELYDKEK
jgi:hypothetical protein